VKWGKGELWKPTSRGRKERRSDSISDIIGLWKRKPFSAEEEVQQRRQLGTMLQTGKFFLKKDFPPRVTGKQRLGKRGREELTLLWKNTGVCKHGEG